MTIFLDACVIIYWVEGVEPWYSRLTQNLDDIRAGSRNIDTAVSELSWLECRIKPLRDNNVTLQAHFERFFSQPSMIRVGLGVQVIDTAARIRARHKLSTPDALQAACALSLDTELVFLTNDRRFDRVPGLKTKVL